MPLNLPKPIPFDESKGVQPTERGPQADLSVFLGIKAHYFVAANCFTYYKALSHMGDPI